MSEVSDYFGSLGEKINPDKIAGMNATYQFNITGDDGGNYSVALANGAAEVAEGTAAAPNITLTIAAADFIALVTGKLNGQTAFLTGKLKIQGDMGLAMKLQNLLPS